MNKVDEELLTTVGREVEMGRWKDHELTSRHKLREWKPLGGNHLGGGKPFQCGSETVSRELWFEEGGRERETILSRNVSHRPQWVGSER